MSVGIAWADDSFTDTSFAIGSWNLWEGIAEDSSSWVEITEDDTIWTEASEDGSGWTEN